MLLICGTVPLENISLINGEAEFSGDQLIVGDHVISCTQGTTALVSAACLTAAYLQKSPPHVVLAGDTGSGKGSKMLYDYLSNNLPWLAPDVLVLHYILPVMGLMKKVTAAAEKCGKKPIMIADASSMYAAKAAGLAPVFDIFTPDLSEMAFLADPAAIHPAYISRHLFRTEIAQAPQLVTSAYKHKNAAKTLLIKGATDYVAQDGRIIGTLSEPDIPAMEAIGGTGDTISGMIGAFIFAGMNHCDAVLHAAKTNRLAGEYAQAKPATKVRDIVSALPEALNNILINWGKKEDFMTEIDVRGLGCPIPVVKTKEAMDKNPADQIIIFVETEVSKENISRLAAMRKYSVKAEQTANEEYRLVLTPALQ